MRRILEDDEPLTLVMAHRFDVGDGALGTLRKAIRNGARPELTDEGVLLMRRAIFASYVDARDHGRREEADALIIAARPSPVVSGEVIIRPAPRRKR